MKNFTRPPRPNRLGNALARRSLGRRISLARGTTRLVLQKLGRHGAGA